jgi:hypothetical protein
MECWPSVRRAYASERIVEYWVLGIWKSGFISKNALSKKIKKLDIYLLSHYSTIPVFLPRETSSYFTGANIPIGAKLLSSTTQSKSFPITRPLLVSKWQKAKGKRLKA